MSIIKEINESHDFIQAKATNLFILPFWYVAIYLFNNEFYVKADSLIIVSMCIAFTLISTFSTTFLFIRINSKKDEYSDFFSNTVVSVAFIMAWLAFLIILFYTLGYLFNIYIYFFWFLVIYSSPIALLYILYILEKLFGDKKEVK